MCSISANFDFGQFLFLFCGQFRLRPTINQLRNSNCNFDYRVMEGVGGPRECSNPLPNPGCNERDRLRPISTLASFFSTSANFDFGHFRLRPISTSANFWMLNFGTAKGRAPKGGGPKISRFFPLLPPQFSFFSPSLGGSFVEFWWCLKRRGPEMCTFQGPGLHKHHQNSTKRPPE